ncbi:MAG: DUF3820 family protein [Candidatus Omnitrophica bacterium]|nr:DUF3820 family protein [Candidatus Omnitrophota bacterium]
MFDITTARISFGKYKGTLYAEVPQDYLLWMKNNITDKPEIIANCEATIKWFNELPRDTSSPLDDIFGKRQPYDKYYG